MHCACVMVGDGVREVLLVFDADFILWICIYEHTYGKKNTEAINHPWQSNTYT